MSQKPIPIHGGRMAPPLPQNGNFDSCPHADDIRAMRKDLHRLTVAVAGEVDSDKPGINERLRDLEQSDKSRKFWTRTAAGAFVASVLTAAGTYVWSKFTGRSG